MNHLLPVPILMSTFLSQGGVYFGLLFTLIICGIGVPLPEEGTFLAAGYIGYELGANVWLLCAIGIFGILLGDLIPYLVGRRCGMSVLQWPMLSRVVTPQRLDRMRDWFKRRGAKTVFFARFAPGLRTPAFFLAGSMHVPIAMFILWDGLGAMLSCPISIWLAYTFGKQAAVWIEQGQSILLLGGALALAFLYFVWRRRGRQQSVTRIVSTPPPEPVTDAADR